MKTVLWIGPVSTSNIENALVPGWTIKTYNRGANDGIGSTAFRIWAESLGNNPISALAPGASEVILAGFSAAHGATEVILEKVAVNRDERLRAVVAADSYYVSTYNTTPKPGHLAWLREIIAARDGRRAIFTTSTFGGPGYLSARDSFDMLAANIGMELDDAATCAPKMPAPYLCWKKGPVLWLNYEHEFSHVQHATKLAGMGLSQVFADGIGRAETPTNQGVGLLGLGLLAGLLWLARKR